MVAAFLVRAARSMQRNRDVLDELDAALGDGDHGENMVTGLRAALRGLAADRAGGARDDVGTMVRRIGHALVSSVGGASGPLYGAAFIEAGFSLQHRESIGVPEIAEALAAARDGLARRGHCEVGDKTILDALAPAADALRAAAERGDDLETGWTAAAAAASEGMLATVELVARRGLALRLGERSRGHQDPGATSCYLLVRSAIPSAPAEPAA